MTRPGIGPRSPAWWIATWFGSGRLPGMPGTWGSLAALPFAWAIHHLAGGWGLVLAAILLYPAGQAAAGLYARAIGREDPGEVVVDEVVGQWLTLAVASPVLLHYALGFALFRAFDILKPWPVRAVERNLPGGAGIMMDDVAAAAYAAACLALLTWLMG